jgi:hypothetical protein
MFAIVSDQPPSATPFIIAEIPSPFVVNLDPETDWPGPEFEVPGRRLPSRYLGAIAKS